MGIILLQDGTLCTGGLDKVVRLWNWRTGLQLKNFLGHTDSVFTVVELPGPGSRVCSGSADRTLRIWNRNSGNPNLNCVMTLTGTFFKIITKKTTFFVLYWLPFIVTVIVQEIRIINYLVCIYVCMYANKTLSLCMYVCM